MELVPEPWRSIDSFAALEKERFPLIKCFGVQDSMLHVEKKLRGVPGLEVVTIRDPLNAKLHCLLVTDREANKGHVLERLFKLAGSSKKQGKIIAAGDDRNDLSMLAKADVRTNVTLRRVMYGYDAIVQLFLLLGMLFVLNIVVNALYPFNFDWTKNRGAYALSDRTKNLVSGLKQETNIVVLIPSIAVGIVQTPNNWGWVIVVIYGVSFLQSQIATPLLVSGSIRLPPVLVLLGQIVAGAFFGFLGLMLAVPLTAILMVLVQEVYIKDMLGDRSSDVPRLVVGDVPVPDGGMSRVEGT